MVSSQTAMEVLVIMTTHMIEFQLDGKIMMKMILKKIEGMTLKIASLSLPLQETENTSLSSKFMIFNTR